LKKKRALILGITGQDGSYLAEFLLSKGYEVHGMIRRSSSVNTWRVDHLYSDPKLSDTSFFLHYGDLSDPMRLGAILSQTQPDEVYNLAAQSHVKVSFDEPIHTGSVVGLGATAALEAVLRFSPGSRFYQASSSEMFGATPPPQSEETSFYPRSPYGVAKVYAFWITRNYREAHNLFAVNGILFNHESPRRGHNFVTKKITSAVAAIHLGLQDKLLLGNLDAIRDWGYAPEYVQGMWKMLQQDSPEDFVLATGTELTVRQFCADAFNTVGLNYEDYVVQDRRYFRPTEVDSLIGDASRAHERLGWSAQIKGKDLVNLMVENDIRRLREKGSDYIDIPIFSG